MKKVTFLTLILFSFSALFLTTGANADSANPPKIGSIVQVTSGPYKPGDIITFDVNVTGGSPAIKIINIAGECIGLDNYWANVPYVSWKFTDYNSTYFAPNRISAIIKGNCVSGIRKIQYVTVQDVTDLSTTMRGDGFGELTGAFSYEVIGGLDLAPGVVRPPMQGDSVDIPALTKTIEYSGNTMSIPLPRLSKGGNTLRWTGTPASEAASFCRIRKEFPGDTGYSLEITGPGRCNFGVETIATTLFRESSTEYSITIESKPAAAKPTADKKVTENVTMERLNIISELEARLARIFEASPELQGKILPTWGQVIKVKNLDLTMSDQIFQQTISPLIKQIQTLERIKTINCVKGKLTKKVTGANPKCPSGYKKK
jgi:hypothetical protein